MSSDAEQDDAGDQGITADLNRVFASTVQFAGLPLASLGIANLIAVHYHVPLLPVGRDIIANYQYAVHWIIGGLYWLPLHFFHITLPDWFHDVAVISVVSSSVSWRAFSGKGNPLTQWDVSLGEMLQWSSWPPRQDAPAIDWLEYILLVLPMFFVNLFAWISGNLVHYVFRIRALAGITAATMRVALRGLALVGIVILIHHLVALIGTGKGDGEIRDRRKQAGRYFLYFGVVIVGVVIFFGELGANQMLH